ncbi:MAG: hypothetical protein CMG35_11875 [Candidatus Marinimicrobia bacterium]|jgi:hypothetical protein|nr:hypothetical protein [Candidatus Neomarinimicrobiota bacterium]MBO03329.1 hypothetical protein [Candidatus Neomarinimicrobiota bacterium]|tara:strand:- start:2427 stop:3362 length:936 start_codon:yes stop_codon:yes gene_type:complete
MARSTAIFINGGAGRVVCSIPALEKFHEENPDDNFLVVCEGGSDFFKGHPVLHAKAYDHWHKNLFEDKLKDMNMLSPEPYRVWEYYNQKCSLSQAYDIAINNQGVRDLPKPTIKLSKGELMRASTVIKEVREKTEREKIIVIQPFGKGIIEEGGMLTDFSGRSIEPTNLVNMVKALSKNYGIIFMGEIAIDFKEHGVDRPIAVPKGTDLRTWTALIAEADYFVGCDSVGQHLAYATGIPSTVVIGSTFPINTSYPNCESFNIMDMGELSRVYSPIRVTVDEFSDRVNEGIMQMNDKIETHIVEEIDKHLGE